MQNAMAKDKIISIILHIIVISGAILMIIPLIWMILSSFKTVAEIFQYPPWGWPENILDFHAYKRLFTEWEFFYWYRNSLIYSISKLVLVLFFTSLAGFAFAKYRFKGSKSLFILLIGSTLIPFQLIVIPLYVMMTRFNWINTWQAIVLPWIAPAFGIFLMRQYILSVPDEMIEASRIDGATEFRIYWQIILPQIKPALATQAIITSIFSWNSLFWPLLMLRGESSYTLPVGIVAIAAGGLNEPVPYDMAMAAGTLASLPFLILFIFLQKSVIGGLTFGAVKQ